MELSPQELLKNVNITDYISQYCELEQKTDGELWGLSPLQQENTPSFSVNEDKQCFFDFSSGQGGDVLDFIQAYHHCNFPQAMRMLAKWANVDLNTEQYTTLEATRIAKKFRTQQTKQEDVKRVVLPKDYMQQFHWDSDRLQPWFDEGILPEVMGKYQVMYDRGANRIVFPIMSVDGDIINISGRTLDKDYKEKKLRKYTYYKPLGKLDTLYGLSQNIAYIKKQKEVILFEGAKSVMLADGYGIPNTCAILTSHLNTHQFRILLQLGVRVVFALDKGVDIEADRNIRKLLPYTDVTYMKDTDGLLDDKDSPIDKGLITFERLYMERRRLT